MMNTLFNDAASANLSLLTFLMALFVMLITSYVLENFLFDEDNEPAPKYDDYDPTILRGNRPRMNQRLGSNIIDLVLVGCGLPEKGMGWHHLKQLLEIKTVNILCIIEPYYMNPKYCPHPPKEFVEFVSLLRKEHNIEVVANVQEMISFLKNKNMFYPHKTLCLLSSSVSQQAHEENNTTTTTTVSADLLEQQQQLLLPLFEQCVTRLGIRNILYYSNNATAAETATQEQQSQSKELFLKMKSFAKKNKVTVYIGNNNNGRSTPSSSYHAYVQKIIDDILFSSYSFSSNSVTRKDDTLVTIDTASY